MAEDIRVGSRVLVPFGIHDLEAVVTRVSKVGSVVRVTVKLQIEGADEPFTPTFRSDEIQVVSAA
ncbi:hypothetical protein ACTG9Q_21650 [Actinokineospora sp. 24-640]